MDYGQSECDDGNVRRGDGCSEECKIEPGFACEGGSPDSSDTCYYTILPQPVIKKVTPKNEFYIGFSQKIKTSISKSLTSKDFVISMKPSR